MTIGLPPDAQTLNGEITAAVTGLLNACVVAQQLAQKINKAQATGYLATVYPNAPDQQAAETLAGQLANVTGVFFGTATQASDFNYNDAFTPYYP